MHTQGQSSSEEVPTANNLGTPRAEKTEEIRLTSYRPDIYYFVIYP